MDLPRVSDSVRRITVLRTDASGHPSPVTLYERQGAKKKKGTRAFRPLERVTRRVMEAQRSAADSYLSRHRESNEKRRDGWMRDFNTNAFKAGRRGTKALKLSRVLSF